LFSACKKAGKAKEFPVWNKIRISKERDEL